MLQEAISLTGKGKAVYVIAHNRDQAEMLKQMAGRIGKTLGIKFETPSSLSNFDWETLRLRGAHPNCIVLVDHYAIEAKFAKVLEMLHRYDPAPMQAKARYEK
jgi:hypothetical protein